MLKSEFIVMKWNSKIKSHYVNLGYVFTQMKDEFLVKVEHLTNASFQRVLVECDYCEKDFNVTWCHRKKSFEDSPIKKDACKNCAHLKAQETMMLRYGFSNMMQIEEFVQKQKESCFEHYGVENPFQAEEVKEKIYASNFIKYGVKSYTQTEEYALKSQKTNLERYGYTNAMLNPIYKEMFKEDKSPVWKGGIHDVRWERLWPKYKNWRMSVFKRDSFICQKCLIKADYLEAHHILNFNTNVDLQYELDNGITFCEDCHEEFHRVYKKRNNNLEQVIEFIQKR